MHLRPYQALCLEQVQAAYRSGRRRVLLCSPTGSGKSALTRYMLTRSKKKTLILVHREDLLQMIADDMDVPYQMIGGRGRLDHANVHLGMMQTVTRRLQQLPAYEWVISDEAHLCLAPTWLKILQHYSRAWHLGMSATPCRLDGRGLGEVYEDIVFGPSIRELTDRGYLVPCRVWAPANRVRIKRNGKEMNLVDAAALIDKPQITGDAVSQLQRQAPHARTLVWACSREHAEHVAEAFRQGGFKAQAVDASHTDRAERIKAFKRSELQVLVSVDLLTTGYNDTSLAAGIMLRPTESLALYLQMIGRLLRCHPGKSEARLFDHVGNVFSHGLPDSKRDWTLDGREIKAKNLNIVQCPACYAVFARAPRCPSCNEMLTSQGGGEGRQVRQVNGDLVEITPENFAAIRDAPLKALLRRAHSRADIELIAQVRGYDQGWVYHVMQHRRRRQGVAA